VSCASKIKKVGDTFILTMPQALLDQHQLSARQQVDLQPLGTSMTIDVPA
jgi:antitoxin component of MazEF toxin-antitoxin module